MELRPLVGPLVNLNRCTFFNVLVTAVVSKVLQVLNLNVNLNLVSTSLRPLFKETAIEMKQKGQTVRLIARSKVAKSGMCKQSVCV